MNNHAKQNNNNNNICISIFLFRAATNDYFDSQLIDWLLMNDESTSQIMNHTIPLWLWFSYWQDITYEYSVDTKDK